MSEAEQQDNNVGDPHAFNSEELGNMVSSVAPENYNPLTNPTTAPAMEAIPDNNDDNNNNNNNDNSNEKNNDALKEDDANISPPGAVDEANDDAFPTKSSAPPLSAIPEHSSHNNSGNNLKAAIAPPQPSSITTPSSNNTPSQYNNSRQLPPPGSTSVPISPSNHTTKAPAPSPPRDDAPLAKKAPKKKKGKGKKGKNEEEEPVEVFVPGQKPGPFSITPDYIFEILERKNTEKLKELGGIEWLMKDLVTDGDKGILDCSGTMTTRRSRYGINELDKKDPATFCEFFIEAFKDPIIIMLVICAIISIIFGMTLPNPFSHEVERETGWIEGTAIIISVLIVTLTGSISNYKKAKRFEEMEKEQSVVPVQVFREGHEVTINCTELVVGDIVVIEGGTLLTCDGIYVHGSDLKCNESAMTGEPDIISKSADEDPFFLSGTQIEEGSGRMIVVAVGMESIQGRLKDATNEDPAETPLQEHLGKLADDIAKLALILAILLVAALFIKEGVLISQGKEATAGAFLRYVIIAITVVVVAIPEGLPLAVTISLAYSMKSMMDDNCLVRVLASCETMGAATAVCSDKTGTLTTNVMSVVQGVVCEEEFFISGYGLRPRAHTDPTVIDRNNPSFRMLDQERIRLFCEALALNSTAREQEIDGKIQWVGNKTEHGLLGFCNLTKNDYKAVRETVSERDQRQYPFNSKKKRMTTIVRRKDGITIFVKGASEVVLESCDTFMDCKGRIKEMEEVQRKEFGDAINDMANQGNRTIGVAMVQLQHGDMREFPADEPDYDTMTFLGVLGIQDPIREEVPHAVKQCHSASIVVRMVTGDNLHTAIAIAKKCHIYEDNNWDHAMTGQEFRDMYTSHREELLQLVPRLRVLARSSPQDKYILVGLLQELGEVVGVTGDGTNDAPALKLANVGFAMQIGTDIAKGAADMVLIDNNFASVVNAVKWGRAVNDNVRKFLQYQLSINVAGVVLTFVGALASQTSKEPFSSVQLLWLNLIMDTLAALALATERACDASLARFPTYKQSKLMSRRMKAFIAVHGLFQVGLVLALLFSGHIWLKTLQGGSRCDKDWPPEHNGTLSPDHQWCEDECKSVGGILRGRYCQQGEIHSTIIFNTFIWFQVFNIWNARKLYGEWNIFEGLRRSIPLVVIVFVIICFQVFAVEVGGKFLDTTGLSWDYWLICIGFGACELIVGVLVRLIPLDEPLPAEIVEKMEKERLLRIARGVNVQTAMAASTLDSDRKILRRDPSLRRSTLVKR